MNGDLREALKLKYKGEMAAAKANIKVYLLNPVGIGEHPDIIAAIDSEMETPSIFSVLSSIYC